MARDAYLEIKSIPDPVARRKRIAGVIVTSLALAVLAALQFFGRLESDKFHERQAQKAENQTRPAQPPTTLPDNPASQVEGAPKFATTAPDNADIHLHDLIYHSPIIFPNNPAPTTQPAPPASK